jgi:SWI/SNF-related matrix-associated actin-dependent regulator of chromatin subfamily A member 5
MEQVESRVFQGQKYEKSEEGFSNRRSESSRQDRRLGKNTVVMVDGFAISKESLKCGEWEAVPTLAGKDPLLAEPKRAKKAPIVNQEVSR